MFDQKRYDELYKRWLNEPNLPDAEYYEFQRMHAEKEALAKAPKPVAAPPDAQPVRAEPQETPEEKAERELQDARDLIRFDSIKRQLDDGEKVPDDDVEFYIRYETKSDYLKIHADISNGITPRSVLDAIAELAIATMKVRLRALRARQDTNKRLDALEAAISKPRKRVAAPTRPVPETAT